jgi:hypothetical protein
MRHLRAIAYISLSANILFSCEKEIGNSDLRNLDNIQAGAYLRQVSVSPEEFSLSNIPGSFYGVTFEAYVGKTGTDDFIGVDIYVKFDGANKSVDEALVKTIDKTEFRRNASNGLLRADLKVTASEAMSTLGLKNTDLSVPATDDDPHDEFTFRQALKLPDGRVYSVDNSSTVLTQPFYKSSFRNIITVVE